MSDNKMSNIKSLITLNDLHLVYVDDEQSQLDYVSSLLSQLGVNIYTTTNQNEAINFIKEKQQDLILIISDLKMPEADGFQFREKVAEVAPQIPFVILSGFLDTELALKCLSLKINGILNKPLDMEGFCEIFEKEIPTRINSIKEDREIKVTLLSDIEQFLDNAESSLIAIDDFTNYDQQINSFFSIIHTIKGASSFFDNKCLHSFTHKYEDGIKKIQNKKATLSEEVHANLLTGLDYMREHFENLKSGKNSTIVDSHFDIFSTESTKSAVESTIQNSNSTKADIKKAETKEIKVNVSLLDDFLKLSGEVIVIKNLLNKCVSSIEKQYSGNKDLETLTELLEELHKINGGVQNKISEIRKVPLKTIFKPIHRGIREVTRSLNKQVNFEVVGEDLSVDNSIAEVLNSSLLHLVKNCVDHGIENPSDRNLAGKSTEGRVKLTCISKDDAVTVVLEDDGRGLNPATIGKKLISNGTHTSDQINSMNDEQLIQMIFSPGFSTASKVTEISGRGVGMSMVKESIESIGGSIKIESKVGLGSKFHLFLPIPKSVLIANCLFVRTNSAKVGITSDEVEKVINLTESNINNFENTQTIFYNDHLVPLIDLDNLLNLEANNHQDGKKIVILKDKQGTRLVGVVVQEILEFEDTIVKPIIHNINTMGFYKGATFVDEGNVSLVLNSEKIMDHMKIMTKNNLSRVESNKQHHNTKSNQLNQALVFQLNIPGFYAIQQNLIYRIEEIRRSDIYSSGDIEIVNYRNTILPIVNMNKILSNSGNDHIIQNLDCINVIVIEFQEYKVGLHVDAILDIVEYSEFHNEVQNMNMCCQGYFFNKEQSVGLIDFDLLRIHFDKLGIFQNDAKIVNMAA